MRRGAPPRVWPLLTAVLVGAGLLLGGGIHLDERRSRLALVERQVGELETRLARPERERASAAGAATAERPENLLRAESDTLAAAELQSRLTAMIAAAGGELQSVRILPVEDLAPFRLIRLETRFGGDHAVLRELLLAVEREDPPLLADSLSVRARDGGKKLLIELAVSAPARVGGSVAR